MLIAAVLLSGACGTGRNTGASRRWQAFTTRYNVYYNGKEHYDETMQDMLRQYEDDYTRFIPVDPGASRADKTLPQPSGDFKRTIEKMQKAIQLHSIKKKPQRRSGSPEERKFRARSEFNPFLHNAWMLMAKSQYYNGDFLGAATTFQYITRHFTWLPKTVTEAKLWQALCYCALGWQYEAENSLHTVKEKDLTTSGLTLLYNKANASLDILQHDYAGAVVYLRAAAEKSHGIEKNRLWFLLGQLYSNLGRKEEAYEAFENAGKGEHIPYRAKFNARIRRSEVYPGGDVKKEINSLKSMTRYARNHDYLDQIYYAMGNLSLASGDSVSAMKYYTLAVDKSVRKGLDEALAMLSLGNLYFSKGDYVKAQKYYNGAVPRLPETYPGYKDIKRRSDVLDKLALYAGNVQLQDSLLQLAAMPEAERLKECERLAKEYIKSQKQKAEEEQLEKDAEKRASEPAAPGIKREPQPEMFMPNADKSWYFYNSQAVEAGKTAFQRKWGARKLEDDWRRKNKKSFEIDSEDISADNQEQTDNQNRELSQNKKGGNDGKVAEEGPETAGYYMRQIPSTQEEILNANDIVQEGLYNMGLILKDELEDFTAARREFVRLIDRYPDNIYRLVAYYNLYMIAIRLGEKEEAEKWRKLIVADFPNSPYGTAMADPNYFTNLQRMQENEENLYESAYEAYLSDRNSEVHRLTAEAERDYPLSKLLPKFVFIDALSYLTEGDNVRFRNRLDMLLQKWQDSDVSPIAANIVKGIREGRELRKGASNSRGMIWTTRLTSDSITSEAQAAAAKFVTEPDKPYFFVLVFPRDSVNANQLLYDVAKFNFSSFVIKDFDLEQMSFGELGMLVIKGFDNLRELEYYRRKMAETGFELPAEVRPVMIGKSNFELLLREGRSFEEYFRFEENPLAPDGLPDPEEDAVEWSPGESGDETEP